MFSLSLLIEKPTEFHFRICSMSRCEISQLIPFKMGPTCFSGILQETGEIHIFLPETVRLTECIHLIVQSLWCNLNSNESKLQSQFFFSLVWKQETFYIRHHMQERIQILIQVAKIRFFLRGSKF
jgi:hypothetical protein